MKRIILLLTIACSLAANAAQRDSISVSGKLYDYFSGAEIVDATITVKDERDSIVLVDSIHKSKDAYWGTHKYKTTSGIRFKLAKAGNYKVFFTCEDYAPDVFQMNIPEKQFRKPTVEWEQNFKIRKLPKERVIDGVVVKATRIKMVVKGDTVEYNADAFDLAEGSMLDKLLEAMPGMELKANGEIYSNGQKVESLLVNGKDFFQGDPKVALENLPAYTVKKVQVYRRDDDAAYMVSDSLKRESMKKLVVDVKLKKEYSKGWMFNSDVAYGTSDRYSAKLFGMYFTDELKFLTWTNFNNLNDRSNAHSGGGWWGDSAPQGLHRIKKGGFSINYDKKDKLEAGFWANVGHTSDDNETKTATTTYLTGGNNYGRSSNSTRSNTTEYNLGSTFKVKNKAYYLDGNLVTLNYTRTNSHSTNRSITLNADPQDPWRGASLDSIYMPVGSARLEKMLLNSVLDETRSLSKNLILSSSYRWFFHSPIFGNDMSFSMSGGYTRNDHENYQHYLLDNRQTGKKEFQNVFTLDPDRSYNYSGDLSYSISPSGDRWNWEKRMKNWNIDLKYNYRQSFSNNRSSRYRLDSLNGWGYADNRRLGELPSNRDSMLKVLEIKNSYHTKTLDRDQKFEFVTSFPLVKDFSAEVNLPVNIQNHKIIDERNNKTIEKTGRLVAFDPSVEIRKYKNNEGVVNGSSISWRMTHSMPDVSSLIDITDDTNPLYISKGNPNLRNSLSHSISARTFYSNAKHMQNYYGSIDWSAERNAIASGILYNRSTGVTTYQPLNINGNWNIGFSGSAERNVDKNDRLQLGIRVNGNYNHSVDYTTDTNAGATEPTRSVVNNYTLNGELHSTYRYKKYVVTATTSADWTLQDSKRANFNRVSAVDMKYALKSNGPLVWGIEYDTNLTLYMRRGYNDASMNDNNLVWNLSLSKSLLKSKSLILRLEAHDLLAQLDNVRNNINSQGRTETWYNSVPRYIMLHVAYKFNTMSKKKAKQTDAKK